MRRRSVARVPVTVMLREDVLDRLDVALQRNQEAEYDPTESRSSLIEGAVCDWLDQGAPATPAEVVHVEQLRRLRSERARKRGGA